MSSSPPDPTVLFYAFPKTPDVPFLSPFCQKLETFLRYTKVPYKFHAVPPKQGPRGKLPYVQVKRDDGTSETVSDSHMIIRYLIENNITLDPDAKLSELQKAESSAWQAYAEGELAQTLAYERWLVPANFDVLTAKMFEGAPRLLRPFIKWSFGRQLHNMFWAKGIGRYSFEEVKVFGQAPINALTSCLDGKIYFHGDEFTTVDAALYGVLVNVLGNRSSPHFYAAVLEKTVLVAYVQRITAMLFPEYEKILKIKGEAS
ncbi:hypothetical protein PAXINDRAFT_121326 [Paxillus involutus ATCC 200175]|uniref:Glutathione transferase n=1 Tax=Paxillus involutus ATCC 200175 TaxID=664439 RepID=A0A0C9TI43_PAXIN|nr:hypothetical protein PAXINDRAFT_121326 [Paxillus involutus ATCC 200175]